MEKNVSAEIHGIARRLTRLRNRAGLTRQELADRAGLTFNTINDIEKSRRLHPMEKTLHCIADALEVSYERLTFGEDDPSDGRPKSTQRPAGSKHAHRLFVVLPLSLLLGIAAFHVKWERGRLTSRSECVSKWTVPGQGAVRFEDIDGDRRVELIRSSNADKTWEIAQVDDVMDDPWSLESVLTRQFDDSLHYTTHTYDLNRDGVRDLINICVDEGGLCVEVIDAASGDVMTSFSHVSATGRNLGILWDYDLRVIYAGFVDTYQTDAVIIRANDSERTERGIISCVDLRTGGELWRYTSKIELTAAQAGDVDHDGLLEVVVWGSSHNGSARYDDSSVPAFAAVLDARGTEKWRREISAKPAEVVACVLPGERSLLFCGVNSGHEWPDVSHILLLDAATGARVDSLPYTEMIVEQALARRTPHESGWDVFCGTEHGVIRRYQVKNGHARLGGERLLERSWVWPAFFVSGESVKEDAFVVATADHNAYVLDPDLNILLDRSADRDAPITPLASFEDEGGHAYVSFMCHGTDICVDRISRGSGWRTRSWYLLGYLISLGMTLVAGGRGHLRGT